MVRKALSIMLLATRPLTLSEMNVAVNIDATSESVLDIDLEDENDFKTRFKSWCGLFISIHQGKLYFLHQTAQEFLLSDSVSRVHTLSEPHWHHSFTAKRAQQTLLRATIAKHHAGMSSCDALRKSNLRSGFEVRLIIYKPDLYGLFGP